MVRPKLSQAIENLSTQFCMLALVVAFSAQSLVNRNSLMISVYTLVFARNLYIIEIYIERDRNLYMSILSSKVFIMLRLLTLETVWANRVQILDEVVCVSLNSFETVWIFTFSLQLWVNNGTKRVCKVTKLGEGKLWITTSCSTLKN